MTTIAWDGKTLASDSRAVSSCMPWETQKLWRLNDGRLYGPCSELGVCLLIRNWLNDPKLPPPVVKDDVGFSGLLIVPEDGKGVAYRLDSYLTLARINGPFHAVGSGRDFAMAAMHLGKSAAEAVEVSKLFDVHTGGPVTTLSLTD